MIFFEFAGNNGKITEKQRVTQFYFWVTLVAEKRDSPTEQITYLCVDYYNYFQSYNYVYLIII